MPLSKPGDTGVTAIVELLAFIRSDEMIGTFAQTPPLLAICVRWRSKKAQFAAPLLATIARSFMHHASRLADQIRSTPPR